MIFGMCSERQQEQLLFSIYPIEENLFRFSEFLPEHLYAGGVGIAVLILDCSSFD